MKSEVEVLVGYKLIIRESDESWDRHEYISPNKEDLYYKTANYIVSGFDPYKDSYCGNDQTFYIQKGKVVKIDDEWLFKYEEDLPDVDFWEEVQASDELARAQDDKLRRQDILKLNKELKSIDDKTHKDFFTHEEIWTWERVSRTHSEWQEELAQDRKEEIEKEIGKFVKVKEDEC